MSAFYVGQKVKKVRGTSAVGITATVIATPSQRIPSDTTRIDVSIDAAAVNDKGAFLVAGEEVSTPADMWEPIVPPGLESLEEINELWQTEPETVRA